MLRSQAVSNSFQKIQFSLFPIKSLNSDLTLPKNRSSSTQDHHLNKYDGLESQMLLPSFMEIGPMVLEKIFEAFLT